MINQIACPKASTTDDALSLQEAQSLAACIQSITTWLDVFYSMPLEVYSAFPMTIFFQLVYKVALMYNLTTCTAENGTTLRNSVLAAVDLVGLLNRLQSNMEQVAEIVGLGNQHSAEIEVFTRLAKMVKSLRPTWEAKLAQNAPTVGNGMPSVPMMDHVSLAETLPPDFADDWLMDFLGDPHSQPFPDPSNAIM